MTMATNYDPNFVVKYGFSKEFLEAERKRLKKLDAQHGRRTPPAHIGRPDLTKNDDGPGTGTPEAA